MKKWIDKTWAKVTAFILLIVFTVLTLAGAAGITWLVSQGVYLDGGEAARRNLFEGICSSELVVAHGYLIDPVQTGADAAPAFTVPPDEAFADRFAWYFQDSPCSIRVESGESLLLSNYLLSDPGLYAVTDHFEYNGQTLSIVAELDPARADLNYRSLLLTRLISARRVLIALEALFFAAWILCLSFTLASAGHWRGYEGIHLTWFDRIPADLWIAGLAILCLLAMDLSFWDAAAFLACGVLLLYLFLPALAAQCKAGTVLKGSVVARVLRLIGRFLRWLGYVLRRIPLVWKTALGAAALLLFDVFCVSNGWDAEFLVAMLSVNLLAALFLVYLAIGLRKLEAAGEALAAGDYGARTDTRWLFGAFRRHGENLNAVQQGVQRAVEQQMRSERMRTELITNVSHDIKTPLTSLVNYVDLLKKEPIDNPTAREYIAVLERQASRLRKLTEDLVEASKAATGNIPVTLADTDVNVFLSQAAGEYRQRLTDSRLEPVMTLDPSEPRILADGKLLWRVLDNLLGNVCKYALPGTRVYLSSEAAGDRVTLTIKNISRYPLNVSAEELTERFVRGDASRSTEGSGLGLSIATGLTRLQKGELLISVDGDLFKAQLSFPRASQ